MTQSFKCPSCNAPLEFEGKPMQKCRFCGSNVIVPSGTIQNSNVFGAFGEMNFSDLSSLTGKALKIAEIQQLIQTGNKIGAIKVFRETFGVGLKEAKDAVEAMERGEGIDISGMRIQAQNLRVVNPQNAEAIKKVGVAVGGSILATTIVVALIIVGAIIAVFYLVSSSVNKSLDRTFTSTSNTTTKTTTTTEKPKLAEEILKFGGKGSGAGKFEDNRHVAIDGNGKIYSSDYQGGKIQVFDSGGKFLTQWIADPKMNLYELLADRKGNVYILQNKGIFVYKGESGELINKAEAYDYKDITLTLDGKIIATTGKGITILDANLKPVQEFKDAAERANTVFGFEDVAVDGNNLIYAVDRQNGDICKFSPEGKFLNRFKSGTSTSRPIAIDNKGRIFVSDVSEIYVFDAEGKQINSFDTTQAFGMVFNDADELFVAARPFVLKYKINF
jgi:hypothetical protein